MTDRKFSPVLAVLAVCALLAGAACEMKMADESYAPIEFTEMAPLPVNVARIEVIERFKPPLSAPHIEHLVPVPPSHALRNWARDRMVARGRGGVARFIIVDASVIQEPLKTTEGLKGLITTDQAARYSVTLKARVEMENATGQGFAEAAATRSRTVPEDTSLAEREKILHAMIGATSKDLDKELERNIRAHLGGFILN